MPDRNRQLGASTTAPTIAPPCTECRGFNVPALVRGRYQRGTCHACGGAGTAEAQQARSAPVKSLVADVRKSISDGSFVDSWPDARDMPVFRTPSVPPAAPQPAPAEATGDVLPLWERDKYGDWSRGMFLPSHILLADGRATIHMGALDPMEWEAPPGGTVEDAMRYVDEAAKIAGHRLPADSMAFRPELAGEVRGTVWHWVPGDNAWTHRARGLRCSNVMRALWDEMPEGQAADALARILRVHGADVREVRS